MKSFSGKLILAGAVAIVTLSSGCATVAVGTAAVTTITVANDRRSVGRFIDDNLIEVKLKTATLTDPQLRGKVHVNFTSMNGIVLVTGEAPSEALKERVILYAKSQNQVRQVVDEVRIQEKSSLPSRNHDAWITTKVKTKLFKTPNLNATKIKVITENSVVYLLGRVTEVEANAAAEAARSVRGVRRVVKIFEIIGQQPSS
ncbi:MAG: BON domain-containing protein [Gammaproteobacteria bacterium]|nr:MAG: BON domain-containing protein [Gammaproteobacteria bacterium]